MGSTGTSGGTITLWDPDRTNFHAFGVFVGILLSGYFWGFPGHIHILNMYAPYWGKTLFWEKIDTSNIMKINGLILAGDANSTLMAQESWGLQRRIDPLEDKLYKLFVDCHLVDICHCPLVSTWTNKRAGERYIGKILNYFLVHEELIERLGYLQSSIHRSYNSDHTPILLNWQMESIRKGIPFKLNKIWLADTKFNNLIHSLWSEFFDHFEGSMMKTLLF